ncbi:hypothetical protein ACFR9U_20585 [Halorientalis brevis]|uniref:DUF8073 domain-containing protein n=1 Tax=Halorientalis brevis TaxID=1126241 RepID=A0ABD6CHQ8_9EURY|nr:hypothetical protein [Halorientalis brevis]
MLLLAVFVVALLIGVSVSRLFLRGTAGPLLRIVGIAVILLAFSIGLYWRWLGDGLHADE